MSKIVVTETSNGQALEVNPGDVVAVHLPENPTSGYVWDIDGVDDQTLQFTQTDFIPNVPSRIGAGGTRVMDFRAIKPGMAHLQLKMWRPWEGNVSATNHFAVAVHVCD